MQSAGVWMLIAVAAAMVATGLPAWMVLLGVALLSCLIGLAAGVFELALLGALPPRVLGLLENDLLQAMPLYVFMGALLNRLPLAEILMRVGSRVLMRTRAGAPLSGLGLGVLLAPMNGSVGAGVAMLARTVLPRLDATGMPRERSAALVTMSSTFGVVIPPSLVLILLSDAMMRAHTEAANATRSAVRIINTQDLFRGALIPAAILLALCAAVTWHTNARDAKANVLDRAPVSLADALTAALTVLVIVGLFAAVTLGFLYAVEAAATGALALLVFGTVRGALTGQVLKDVLRDAMAVTGALFALLIGATVFTLVVRGFGTDRWVVALFMHASDTSTYTALFAVMLILGSCAFVLDAFEIIFVVVPILMPPLLMRVPDATWVAVLALLILQASFLLPPFGYAVLMLRNRLGGRLDELSYLRALAPYLAAQAIVLALVVVFPHMLWQDRSSLTGNAPNARPLSEDEANELLRRQTEPQPLPQQ
jgi:tripartite ATP-independent transporter DctM subunit